MHAASESFIGPVLSHIFFVNDTLIFMRANEKNCTNLVKLLRTYCDASGQEVNLQKSSVFFGANTPVRVSEDLRIILGMPVVDNPGTYLGVPALWGRSKKRGLAYVKGRIVGKLQGWKHNTHSKAGKEVLIKAVAQAIPTYPMSIFKFPAMVCEELDALVAGFWWGNTGGNRKIHWVSNEVLGLPKHLGGLGFRNFKEFNDALLAKQCWRLLCDPSSLWARVLKARYFPNYSFLDANKGGRASWAWSSLLTGRDLLLNGSHWQIIGGQDVRVWVDRWLPSLPLGHPTSFGEVEVTRNLRVSTLICPQSRDWDITFLHPRLSVADQEAIRETPIRDNSRMDRLIWAATKNGRYSVKSGYRWVQSRSLSLRNLCLPHVRLVPDELWKYIWKVEVPPEISHFLWSSLHSALATNANLFKRWSSTSPPALFVFVMMKPLNIFSSFARGSNLFGGRSFEL